METTQNIEELRAEIAALSNEEDRLRNTHSVLRTRRNELALLTATIFITIESWGPAGERAGLYGPGSETVEGLAIKAMQTHPFGEPGNFVLILYQYKSAPNAFFEIRLRVGDRVTVTATEDLNEGLESYFRICVFATRAEAEQWLQEQQKREHPEFSG